MIESSFPVSGQRKSFTPDVMSGVKRYTPRFHPAYGRSGRSVALCPPVTGGPRPGRPGPLGSGTAAAYRGTLPPKHVPLCAPPVGFFSVIAALNSCQYSTGKQKCQPLFSEILPLSRKKRLNPAPSSPWAPSTPRYRASPRRWPWGCRRPQCRWPRRTPPTPPWPPGRADPAGSPCRRAGGR